MRFEALDYPGCLPHVLGRFSVPKHSLKRLSALPLRVVGDPRTVEASVDIRRDETLLFPHHCLSGVNQHIHQTLLILWGNSEYVDEGHHIVVLRDGNHTLSTSYGLRYASYPG